MKRFTQKLFAFGMLLVLLALAQACIPTATRTPDQVIPATPTSPPPPATPPSEPTTSILPTQTSLPPTSSPAPTLATQTDNDTSPEISTDNAQELQPTWQEDFRDAQSIAWSPDSKSLAVVSQSQVMLVDTTTSLKEPVSGLNFVREFIFSPDGRHYSASGQENQLFLGELAGTAPIQLGGHGDGITSIVFSPDGSQLVSAGFDNTLIIWDTESGKRVDSAMLTFWLQNLSFAPSGGQLGGLDAPNSAVHITRYPQFQEVSNLQWADHASPVIYGAIFSPDWQTIAWYARGTVQFQSVDSGQLGTSLEHEDFINSISWSSDSKVLATASAATINDQFTPVISLWDVTTAEIVDQIALDTSATQVDFSPDGRSLASLSADGLVQIWTIKP